MDKLEQKIKEDLVSSLKAREELRSSVLRMLIADIKNKSIEKKSELNQPEIEQVIKSSVKRRKDSIESYQSGGRNDLAEKEEKEIKILAEYLPEQMDEEEVKKIITDVISEVGVSSPADFGKVMGAVMARLKGQADGDMVSKIVKEKLS